MKTVDKITSIIRSERIGVEFKRIFKDIMK